MPSLSFWTKSAAEIKRPIADVTATYETQHSRSLKAGMVWVNCYGEGNAGSPFGGYKQSGIGREGGKYSVDFYTQVKSVFVKL